MAEISRFWNGLSVGDATESPYDAPTEFSEVLMACAGLSGAPNKGGVLQDYLGDLAASGAASPVTISSGGAVVYGGWYSNSASVAVTVPTPSVSTRVDRVVLRKDWTAQTIRLVRIAGVEGGGPPGITQVVGTTWDFPLWRLSTTTGGVVTLLDDRSFIPYLNNVRISGTVSGAAEYLNPILAAPNIQGPLDPASLVGTHGIRPLNFVPVLAGSFPTTNVTGIDNIGVEAIITGLPAEAVVAVVQVAPVNTTGSIVELTVASDLTASDNTCLQMLVPASSGASASKPQCHVPITVPTKITLALGTGFGPITCSVRLVGYYEYM